MRKLTIAYVGNFRHAHCTEVHLARSFRRLGHHVEPMQEEHLAQMLRRERRRGQLAVPDADLVLYTRTHSVGLPPNATDLWLRCHDAGVQTASFHLDLFFGLAREQLVTDRDPLFTTGHAFTADGDHEQEFRRAGVCHHWVRAGVVEDECFSAVSDQRWYGIDVAFVGSPGLRYHSEWPWRGELLRYLQDRYGDRFRLIPTPGQPAVRNTDTRDDLNRLYATIPVIVGDSLLLRGRASRYWSDRVYETLGRGGFIVMPEIDALQEEIGFDACGWYEQGNLDSVGEAVDYWLDNPRERDETRRRGQKVVRDSCTYTQRAAEILAVIRQEVPFDGR